VAKAEWGITLEDAMARRNSMLPRRVFSGLLFAIASGTIAIGPYSCKSNVTVAKQSLAGVRSRGGSNII